MVIPIKTLVELVDGCQIENVVAGLKFKPEKIIYIGFKHTLTDENKSAIETLFRMKGIDISIEYEVVGRYNFNAITERLRTIIDNNEECVFDISGGKDIVLAAIGAVCTERNTPMVHIDVESGKVINVNNFDASYTNEKSVLTIAEAVALNGCSVIHNPPEDFNWDMTDDFKNDIEVMWGICKKDCEKWNWQSAVLKNFEKFFHLSDSFSIDVDVEKLKSQHQQSHIDGKLLTKLISNGLILDYSKKGSVIHFRYKNKQVHECITKAGDILELYSYMLMKEIAVENSGWYDDIDIGVYIDWDGIINEDSSVIDVKNEIDIVAMRDLIPLFISCKNGEVPKEALYELQTVADKFGGRYAGKYMLATYISRNKLSKKYIIQRAQEMGIKLIYDLHLQNREEFKNILKAKVK